MPLILWSGGCDSTLLLHNALRDWKAHKDLYDATHGQPHIEGQPTHTIPPNIPVRTLTIIHPNVVAVQEQRNARQALREHLKKQGYTWPHMEITITHQTPALNGEEKDGQPDHNAHYHAEGAGEHGGLIQPILWIPTATPYLTHYEDLALGYIKGDDAQFYLTTLRNAFDNLQWIAGRIGKLVTPLDNTSKAEIIHHLKQANIYKYTWHCEAPQYDAKKKTKKEPPTLEPYSIDQPIDDTNRKQIAKGLGKPCGKCAPCMTHATALWQLTTGNSYYLRLTTRLTKDGLTKLDDETKSDLLNDDVKESPLKKRAKKPKKKPKAKKPTKLKDNITPPPHNTNPK